MTRLALLAALLFSSSALAEGRESYEMDDNGHPLGTGIGIILGEPTGLSIILRQDERTAIAGGIAWSLESDSLHIHGDYQLNLLDLKDPNAPFSRFPVYAGIGARLKTNATADNQQTNFSKKTFQLGLRIPFGISLLPPDKPFDGFIEIVPVMNVLPSTDFDLEGGIGARFYF